MLKQFSSCCGYDLKTGCRIISVVSAITSVLLAVFFFYVTFNGLDKKQSPDFSDYGSVRTFMSFATFLGVKQIIHLIFCYMLFTGSKSDNVYGIRCWLKSNVIGLCILLVIGSYCEVLLFVGGSKGIAVLGAFMMFIFVPMKIYFALVVNSYHSQLAPDHIWGSTMRVNDNMYPRTCRTVPPVLVHQPAAVVVTA